MYPRAVRDTEFSEFLYLIPYFFFNMTKAVHETCMIPSMRVDRCVYRYTWPSLAMVLVFFFFSSLKHGCGCFNIAEMSHPHRGAFNWDSSWDWLFLLCLTGVCAGSVRAPCSAAVCYCVSSSAVALALTICFFSGKGFFFHCWLFRTDYQVTIVTI